VPKSDLRTLLLAKNMGRYTEMGDGILGHLFDKRLDSFAPCYSQSLLMADFKEKHTLLGF
jgi:hypothetical protein